MSESSADIAAHARKLSARSRKALQLCMQGLAKYGQAPVAEALGVHVSTVSRLQEHLPNLMGLLETIGLKVVGENLRCYDPKDIDAILHLAKRHMVQTESADDLHWEDDE